MTTVIFAAIIIVFLIERHVTRQHYADIFNDNNGLIELLKDQLDRANTQNDTLTKHNRILTSTIVDVAQNRIENYQELLESTLELEQSYDKDGLIEELPFDFSALGITEEDMLVLFQGNVEYDEHGKIIIG